MAAVDNKTLRTTCSKCGKDLPTDVDPDVKQRQTWPLMGVADGEPAVFATCTKCYNDGWRPPGHPA